MKRISLFVMTAVLLFAYGCGQKNTQEEAPAEAPAEATLAPLVEEHVEALSEGDAVQASAANTVGLMAFYPNSDPNMYALAGSNEVTFYFQNAGISGGTGRIGVYDAMTNALYATASPSETGFFSPMDDNGKELTEWTDGTKADVYFSKSFQPGKNYYMLMDAACFMLDQVESEPVDNASLLTFGVKEYGISGELYEDYNVGDTATINVMLGGDAKMAQLKNYDTALITTTASTFTSSQSFDVTFNESSAPKFTVAFFDDAGQQIDTMDFAFGVGGVMADVGTPIADDGSSIDKGQVEEALKDKENAELDDAGVFEGEEVESEDGSDISESTDSSEGGTADASAEGTSNNSAASEAGNGTNTGASSDTATDASSSSSQSAGTAGKQVP